MVRFSLGCFSIFLTPERLWTDARLSKFGQLSQQSIGSPGMSYPLLGNKVPHPLGWCLLCLATKQPTPWGGVSFAGLSYSKSKGIYHPFVSVLENCSPVAPKTTMEIILSFRGAQYHCKAQICVLSAPDKFLCDESCKLWLSPKDNSCSIE